MRLWVPVVRECIRHRHGILGKDSYCPHFVPDPLDKCGVTGYIIGVGGRKAPAPSPLECPCLISLCPSSTF